MKNTFSRTWHWYETKMDDVKDDVTLAIGFLLYYFLHFPFPLFRVFSAFALNRTKPQQPARHVRYVRAVNGRAGGGGQVSKLQTWGLQALACHIETRSQMVVAESSGNTVTRTCETYRRSIASGFRDAFSKARYTFCGVETACILVSEYRRFGWKYCLLLQSPGNLPV
jgi:hypothetical protein